MTVDSEYCDTFGVRVCSKCRRLKEFDLVPKAKAKQVYLLTDKELNQARKKTPNTNMEFSKYDDPCVP